MLDWNDLKYLLAVARHQGTAAASRALGVNQSTVQRRLVELERNLGQPLVQRHSTGYRLTSFGEQLLPLAQQVEQAVVALTQHVENFLRDVTGVVRVTCPEPLVYRISNSTLLDRFRSRYPALQVEFVTSDRYLDFAKGEVDIALRSGDTDDNALVGRKVGDSLWAVYASPKYIARRGRPDSVEELERHDWVGFDDTMAQHRAASWLAQVAPKAHFVARNNSVLGLVYSAKAGIGLAALPTALGDAEPDLVRVLGPIPELARIWRVLTTPELRHTPRVAALFDFLVDEVEALRPIITG
ncbi:LysR family transcriptional regulator [Candidatus Aalborgicola defluviihabitans]|uniref:LysR family transcriptional regulator n=1 Tax=Candidatus Aalborgicola defluviihabitans TaxID=3386187 RepID=UPI00390B84A6|nr:LysR family transcriptional regulator [Burkholderiales bacterium]